jgi:hypothetical protein
MYNGVTAVCYYVTNCFPFLSASWNNIRLQLTSKSCIFQGGQVTHFVFLHISSGWVKIRLQIKMQLPFLLALKFPLLLHSSSVSCVKIRLHTETQLLWFPGTALKVVVVGFRWFPTQFGVIPNSCRVWVRLWQKCLCLTIKHFHSTFNMGYITLSLIIFLGHMACEASNLNSITVVSSTLPGNIEFNKEEHPKNIWSSTSIQSVSSPGACAILCKKVS